MTADVASRKCSPLSPVGVKSVMYLSRCHTHRVKCRKDYTALGKASKSNANQTREVSAYALNVLEMPRRDRRQQPLGVQQPQQRTHTTMRKVLKMTPPSTHSSIGSDTIA